MKPEEMWSRFCTENGIDSATHYEAWQLGDAPDNLAALVMQCYEKVGFKITREYYEDSYITPGEMYEMILAR